jgi:hypothetical protein
MQPNPVTQQSPYSAPVVRDLCQACAHVDHCALREMPTTPVHDCDEYDDGTRAAPLGALWVHQHQPSRPAPVATGIGLCVNCEHRETCTLPRAESGVWNCEEYR